MFIDPLTFLIARRRAKGSNLSSGEILKATLLGSAVGNGNAATGVFFTDRTIKQKIERSNPIVIEPVTCMDSLISSIETFLSCMEQDKDNVEKLAEYKRIFSEVGKHLIASPAQKKAVIERLEKLTSKSAENQKPKTPLAKK